MLSDIADFIEFLGCLNNLGGKKEKRKVQLTDVLGEKSVFDDFNRGSGFIAFDPLIKRFGYALLSEDATFFDPAEVVKAELLAPGSKHLVLHVRGASGEWSRTFKFRSQEKAERWRGLLSGQT
ncbi:hypothetical protein EON81_22165 [bacterium]|nr:MAG: hypothetical protein EON81_22165 [bacterium]